MCNWTMGFLYCSMHSKSSILLLLLITAAIAGCNGSSRYDRGPAEESRQETLADTLADYRETGIASYYHNTLHGSETANGETYDMYALTAAHATLPFGAFVEVTNLENGRAVTVKINDHFPGTKGRMIDLSWQAAKEIDLLGDGTAEVEIRVIEANGQ